VTTVPRVHVRVWQSGSHEIKFGFNEKGFTCIGGERLPGRAHPGLARAPADDTRSTTAFKGGRRCKNPSHAANVTLLTLTMEVGPRPQRQAA
jgi:hypothetical protein